MVGWDLLTWLSPGQEQLHRLAQKLELPRPCHLHFAAVPRESQALPHPLRKGNYISPAPLCWGRTAAGTGQRLLSLPSTPGMLLQVPPGEASPEPPLLCAKQTRPPSTGMLLLAFPGSTTTWLETVQRNHPQPSLGGRRLSRPSQPHLCQACVITQLLEQAAASGARTPALAGSSAAPWGWEGRGLGRLLPPSHNSSPSSGPTPAALPGQLIPLNLLNSEAAEIMPDHQWLHQSHPDFLLPIPACVTGTPGRAMLAWTHGKRESAGAPPPPPPAPGTETHECFEPLGNLKKYCTFLPCHKAGSTVPGSQLLPARRPRSGEPEQAEQYEISKQC